MATPFVCVLVIFFGGIFLATPFVCVLVILSVGMSAKVVVMTDVVGRCPRRMFAVAVAEEVVDGEYDEERW